MEPKDKIVLLTLMSRLVGNTFNGRYDSLVRCIDIAVKNKFFVFCDAIIDTDIIVDGDAFFKSSKELIPKTNIRLCVKKSIFKHKSLECYKKYACYFILTENEFLDIEKNETLKDFRAVKVNLTRTAQMYRDLIRCSEEDIIEKYASAIQTSILKVGYLKIICDMVSGDRKKIIERMIEALAY